MRRLNLVLLASLQLCGARQPGFSTNDDLLAHPQFEVVFADDFISESDALALVESSRTASAPYTADASQSDVAKARESAPAPFSGPTTGAGPNGNPDDDDDAPIAETYELINSAPWRYLCAVPVIAPPPVLNKTATELAKAEEARELSRASAKGWELMSGLDGQCMYFMSGWWSYSFCYGKTVVQYHALPGRPGEPPVRDKDSQEYILGRAQTKWPLQDHSDHDGETKSLTPPNAQLQIKGDQRYLSQRLEGGTICDLTGRPRTIEIQYHCSPGTTADRIGWIKEVTTCTYLMVVYTPRLCNDIAFQPPKETRAHPIRCRQIISSAEDEAAWRTGKLELGYQQQQHQNPLAKDPNEPNYDNNNKEPKDFPPNYYSGTALAGITIGAKKHVDDTVASKLPLPRGISRGGGQHQQQRNQVQGQGLPMVEVLARKKKDAKKVEVLSDEELEKLDLDPKTVKEFREEMERLAGDRGWKLQAVEVAGGEGVEYVGAFDDEEGWDGYGDVDGGDYDEGRRQGSQKGERRDGSGEVGGEEEQEGSEEVFFKEEL